MFCRKCGEQLPEDGVFCPNCGAPVPGAAPAPQPSPPPYQPQPGPAPQPSAPPYQPQPTPPYQAQPAPPYPPQPAPEQTLQPTLPMKWHKFLIYFSLWAGGILNIGTGILTMTGLTYDITGMVDGMSGGNAASVELGTVADAVYTTFPAMRAVDLAFGGLVIALGLFTIFTRFRLAGLRKGAPALLTVVYIVSAVANVAYFVGVVAITAPEAIAAEAISGVISPVVSSIVMIFVNMAYYKKRKALFCN